MIETNIFIGHLPFGLRKIEQNKRYSSKSDDHKVSVFSNWPSEVKILFFFCQTFLFNTTHTKIQYPNIFTFSMSKSSIDNILQPRFHNHLNLFN